MKKIFFTSLFATIIVSLICVPAGSGANRKPEAWTLIHKDKQSVYIDKNSVKRSARTPGKVIVRVRAKIIYEQPEPDKSGLIEASFRHYEFFCTDSAFRILQETVQFTDGTSEIREDLETREWEKLNQHLLENAIYKHVCK